MYEQPPLPGNQYAYLFLAFYTALVGATFFSTGGRQVEWTVQVLIASIMFGGLLGAGGAHILDGGSKPNARALARRFDGR